MKLTLTDEQTMLADSVARFMADRADAEINAATWREIAELGWLGAGVTEAAGGFGGGREMAIVMEQTGHSPLAEALAPNFIALAILEQTDPNGDLISAILSGTALACGLVPEMADAGTVLVDDTARTVSGRFRALQHATEAGHFVLALPDVTLAFTPDASGVERHSYHGLDGLMKTDLTLKRMSLDSADVLADGPGAAAVLSRARATRAATVTSECCGLAARLFGDTLAYLKQRKQFGQPIGSFQAVQHRLADMFVEVEEIRSLALAAARAAADGTGTEGPALSQTVIGATERALHVAREAIQLHGGVGMTEDLPLGAALRRLKLLQLMPGGAESLRRAMRDAAA